MEIDVTQIDINEFKENGAKINFSSQLNDLFDLKYFKKLQVGYTLKFVKESDEKLYNGGKIALASKIVNPEVESDQDQLNGYGDGVAVGYLPDKSIVGSTNPYSGVLDINLDNVKGPAVGINIQLSNGSWAWPDTTESITITSIKFVAEENAVYEAKQAE
ncbi:MAG: hypothetical protein K1W06_07510 [Lachnospiraceae bacterium]